MALWIMMHHGRARARGAQKQLSAGSDSLASVQVHWAMAVTAVTSQRGLYRAIDRGSIRGPDTETPADGGAAGPSRKVTSKFQPAWRGRRGPVAVAHW